MRPRYGVMSQSRLKELVLATVRDYGCAGCFLAPVERQPVGDWYIETTVTQGVRVVQKFVCARGHTVEAWRRIA